MIFYHNVTPSPCHFSTFCFVYSIKKIEDLRTEYPNTRINMGLGTDLGTLTVKGLFLYSILFMDPHTKYN